VSDNDQLRSRLPVLPPAPKQRRLDVTGNAFIAWDIMRPWQVTAVAFVRGNEGEFTAWTPGHHTYWVWRGPSRIPVESARDLASWLTQKENPETVTDTLRVGEHTEIRGKAIWIWDPDLASEMGPGVLRLDTGGFELSLMMAGLRRGGARIGTEDGDLLARWLISDSVT
jgi:hypothetical protein